MKKGKKRNLFSEPLLHLVVAMIGLSLIAFLPDTDHVCDGYKRVVSSLMDIGVGLFPTGLIGLILVFMQKSQKENERFEQRISLLRELDIHLHNLLNEICRNITASQQTSKRSAKQILALLHDTKATLTFTNTLKECAAFFSSEISKFLSNKTDYLMNEIFNADEMDALILLTESLNAFVREIESGNTAQVERCSRNMITCILKLLKKMPEFSAYLKLTFIGDHIQ